MERRRARVVPPVPGPSSTTVRAPWRFAARTTLYTLTDRRVVMRIGIVLTVAYNLPLVRIEREFNAPVDRVYRERLG